MFIPISQNCGERDVHLPEKNTEETPRGEKLCIQTYQISSGRETQQGRKESCEKGVSHTHFHIKQMGLTGSEDSPQGQTMWHQNTLTRLRY
jgi:hypothetical protein